LFGQLTKGIHFSVDMVLYVAVAFTGGLLGAYLGALRFPQAILKNVLGCVLAVAAYKLLFT
ncbi:MAG: sulfite exporter TauE/SafE family protein, partial [Ferruginibacter sp.]|nr:sulfite exporter TauE/SafE family protein [Ferruginibacter sp.]